MPVDYIFFIYGLAFFYVGAVCLSMRQGIPEAVPWKLLGLFGVSHGTNEWLDLVALSIGDSPAFMLGRLVVMTLSYVMLFEFGRCGAERLGWRGLSWWLVLPMLLAVALTAGCVDLATANGLARLLLAVPGCLLTALVLVRRARSAGAAERPWLPVVAGGFLVYGVAAGLVGPVSTLPLAAILNQQSFLAATGVPIQLVRGGCAVLIAMALWAYDLERTEADGLMRKSRRHFWLTSFALVVVVAAGSLFTDWMGRLYDADQREELSADLVLMANGLTDDLREAEGAALALAGSGRPGGGGAVPEAGGPLPATDAANQLVDRFHQATGGDLTYLMDRDGRVLAASNRDEVTSLVGQNYAFRPYFQEALAGRPGHYFAFGATTHQAGYFASHPIRDTRDGPVVGVAVVKVPLDADRLGFTRAVDAYLIDPNGIVLLTGRAGMQLRTLWPLPSEAIDRASSSRQFDPFRIEPLLAKEPRDGASLVLGGERMLVGRKPVGDQGWSLLLLKKEKTAVINRLFGIVVTLLVSCLILGHFVLLRRELNEEFQLSRRQRRIEELLLFNQRGTEALRQSRELLDCVTRLQSRFIGETDVASLFDAVLDDVVRFTGSRAGFLAELFEAPDGTRRKCLLAISGLAGDEGRGCLRDGTPFGLAIGGGHGLPFAVAGAAPVILDRPALQAAACRTPPGHPVLESFLWLPLHRGGVVIGGIGLADRPGGYDQDIAAVIQPVVSACSQIIEAWRNHRQRQDAATALAHSEQRYRALVETQADMVIRVDASGRFTFVNDTTCRVLGRSRDELIGTPWPGIVSPADAGRTLAMVGAARISGASFRAGIENRVLTAAAGERWYAWECCGIFDVAGTLVEVQATGRDSTDRRRIEDALRQARDEAEAAARARAVFLATMSHELRTPLSSIIGFGEMITTMPPGSEFPAIAVDYARDIVTSGYHLLDIINRVLDCAKIESGLMTIEPSTLDVRYTVAHAIREIRHHSARRGVGITLSVPRGLPLLRADRHAVYQILSNLISNAITFTPAGGTISVSARSGADGGIELVVADTGIGISESQFARIRKPFEQGDTRYARIAEGIGLGLFLVESLVALHGGRVQIASTVGVGTTVMVWFPPSGPPSGPES
jgi:PAS domain S-box-containing protein